MVFIDNLAYSLFAVSFAGFMLLYTTCSIYLAYRKNRKNFSEDLKSASIPLAVIGMFLFLTGIWGQFTWPLPGSYNMLFYDPLISFGFLLLAFSISIKYGAKLEYTGFLGLMVGMMVIVYGVLGYTTGLTKEPLALLAMYLFYGLAGIFSYPISLMADRLPGLQRGIKISWFVLLVIFCILLLLASGLSGMTGIIAIPQHLISAP